MRVSQFHRGPQRQYRLQQGRIYSCNPPRRCRYTRNTGANGTRSYTTSCIKIVDNRLRYSRFDNVGMHSVGDEPRVVIVEIRQRIVFKSCHGATHAKAMLAGRIG